MHADRRGRVVLVGVYAILALFMFTEQWGRATNDTRFELTEVPGAHLLGTLHLWNPEVSLGELQNQAYGYLFPQGAFFALFDAMGSPGWVTQRLWSILVLILACEGLRRLALALGISWTGAAVAGLAYGLVPRHVTEIATRSAEILPGAVLPWALLPIVLAVQGRLRPRAAAVLSAAAFACSGGVNGTATAAPAALLAVVVGWAVWRRWLSWRFGIGWLALIGAVSAWWLLALLRLGEYSPPFFDYVEDARTTTSSSGFGPVLRGASNWVGYITVGGERWWPAGYDLAYEPLLVLGSGLVAVIGVVGLLRMRSQWRTPLLIAAIVGLTGQVIAHTGALDSPLSQPLQDLLDGALAPLRNVPKLDPVLRVPLMLGVGVVVDDLVRHWRARRAAGGVRRSVLPRQAAALGLVLVVVAGLGAMAQPIATADTRTPGWTQVPDYWTDAAQFLADRAEDLDEAGDSAGATWVVPGSAFGVQRWGWTMEETMEAVGLTSWTTRSQVPLTPSATIRLLSALETFLETGAGSPYLQQLLNRMGIDTILLRHDLNPNVSQATSSRLVGVALGRSPGLENVATFGRLDFGPAIEVYEVEPPLGAGPEAGGFDVRDTADAVTVAGSVEAYVDAVAAGLVGPSQPVVLEGTPGWEERADVVGDGYRRRERAFGQIHDSESNVMTPTDRYRVGRVVPNYPGEGSTPPVVARYEGIVGIDASSSRGWADTIGTVQPENAPWSVFDDDPTTFWRPAPYLETLGQWLEVDFGKRRMVRRIELTEAISQFGISLAGRWRITAGDVTREVETDPFTGRASVYVGAWSDKLRIEVLDAPSPQAAVGIADLDIAGVDPERTLVLPEVDTHGAADIVLGARPEQRACVMTLAGTDCDRYRRRGAEEGDGIVRTVPVSRGGTYDVSGVVVARSRAGTADLLQPLAGAVITASSWLAEDPAVSPRMAHDRNRGSAWVADPRDERPTLTVNFGQPREIRRLRVVRPGGNAVRPDHATIRASTPEGEIVREVDLAGFGRFEPFTAEEVRVTFERRAAVVGDLPLGVGEVRLVGGLMAQPLDTSGPTGAVCGLGPQLVVDGTVYRTRVSGVVGDVLAAGQLSLEPCGRAVEGGLDLGAGEHQVELLSTEQFQPVALRLDARGSGAEQDSRPSRSRSLDLVSRSDTKVVLELGAGEEAILASPSNTNAGWVASIDGHELEPIAVDGWAQGWVVPSDLSGRVDLLYQPQRGYLVSLVAGLVVLAAVLVWALALLLVPALRRSPGSIGQHRNGVPAAAADPPEPDAVPTPERGPWRRRVAVLVAPVLAWLIGGPVVALGALAGALLAPRRRLVEWVVVGALVATLVWFVVMLTEATQIPTRAQDLVTGAALALGITAALLRRPEEQ